MAATAPKNEGYSEQQDCRPPRNTALSFSKNQKIISQTITTSNNFWHLAVSP
jgi:hypothetical protein